MKFYNNKNGIILIICIFLIESAILGINCPCDGTIPKDRLCTRYEFYGVQLNHFVFFMILGLCFPSYFYTWMIIGVLFELLEHLLDRYPEIVIKYIGGCLSEAPLNFDQNKNKITKYYVFKGVPKYLNPID